MTTTEKAADGLELRKRIIEAAQDIVSEEGLGALSMRSLAVRVGYSPATIYHHFQDKDELLRSVVTEGFQRLGAAVTTELSRLGGEAAAVARLAATARAYARFALDQTGFFRAMYEMPEVACLEGCPQPHEAGTLSQKTAVDVLRGAALTGELELASPERAMLLGWGLIHGLTSLYLGGHLAGQVSTHDEFMELIDSGIEALRTGWRVA
jgi:AcrR family transcriptional regulator